MFASVLSPHLRNSLTTRMYITFEGETALLNYVGVSQLC